jgi:hypothetical protein
LLFDSGTASFVQHVEADPLVASGDEEPHRDRNQTESDIAFPYRGSHVFSTK